jgi:hypothetical protein
MNWRNFFAPGPRELFLTLNPLQSTWRVVSWNFDLKNPSERLWSVDIVGAQEQSVQWSRHLLDSRDEVSFFKAKKLVRSQAVGPKEAELRELMNLTIHSTLKYGLESNHDFLLTPVSGATTMDFQNEARALQWIQASFGTLMRALDRMKDQDDLILTAGIFCGHRPDGDENVLRILAFNLDIFCYFRADFSLQLVIFDDKNLGHGQAKTPTFQQIIKVTKPQIYDEIVKLVHRIGTVGEIS